MYPKHILSNSIEEIHVITVGKSGVKCRNIVADYLEMPATHSKASTAVKGASKLPKKVVTKSVANVNKNGDEKRGAVKSPNPSKIPVRKWKEPNPLSIKEACGAERAKRIKTAVRVATDSAKINITSNMWINK